MKKTAFFFLVVLTLNPLSETSAGEAHEIFDVRAKLIGLTDKQEKKIRSAIQLIKTIIRSQEFKKQILEHTWRGKKQFADNQGLSNEAIYQKIILGSELISKHGPNHTMDLEIEMYTDPDSLTIGYTYPSIARIYMNQKYFRRFRPHQVADNMMHEWLHKLGFNHSLKHSPDRPFSVPYAVGYLVEELAKKTNK